LYINNHARELPPCKTATVGCLQDIGTVLPAVRPPWSVPFSGTLSNKTGLPVRARL